MTTHNTINLYLWDNTTKTSSFDAIPLPCTRGATPRKGQTQSGYGRQIPTGMQVLYKGRWWRVKVAIYGNAGTAYIGKPDAWIGTIGD